MIVSLVPETQCDHALISCKPLGPAANSTTHELRYEHSSHAGSGAAFYLRRCELTRLARSESADLLYCLLQATHVKGLRFPGLRPQLGHSQPGCDCVP